MPLLLYLLGGGSYDNYWAPEDRGFTIAQIASINWWCDAEIEAMNEEISKFSHTQLSHSDQQAVNALKATVERIKTRMANTVPTDGGGGWP